MWRFRTLLAIALLIAYVGLIGAYNDSGAGEESTAATAEEIAQRWSYPDKKYFSTHEGGGPLRLREDFVEIEGSYDETLAKIDKFYSEKCGSSKSHAEPKKMIFFDKAEASEGGKSLVSTLHMYQKDIWYLHATKDYTVNVLVRPARRGDPIEIIITVATR